ncbi:DUF4836 family protein [Danxiaibacter flavus]|uniref:DUF4836 family protein n=1 Tax=Danxiaibacter flavus TaxID=3049108 RepID=A0ABV3ZFR7_9BACT|nr:DUF4836 family protein [Chitinophagaceae bacterium DXS]
MTRNFVTRCLLFCMAVALIATSCKKSVPKQVTFIPKDATMVFSVNAKSVTEKLSKSSVNLDSLFNTIFKDSAKSEVAKMKSAVGDLKNAGIDWSSDVYFFLKNKGSIMTGQQNAFAAIALIKDAGKFEAYLKKQKPEAAIKKESKYSYAVIDNDVTVGWNSDVIIVAGNKEYNRNTASSGQPDDGHLLLNTLYEQKEAESIASIPEFVELAKEKSDATVFTNSSGLLNNVPMLSMTKASDLLNNAYSATTINFEDGEIVASSKGYSSPALKDILKKYPGQKINMDMINKYPSSNVDGFILLSFNPQILIDIIKYSGFDVQANQYLNEMGFTLDDVAKAFKGEFSFVVSDLAVVKQPNPYYPQMTMTKPDMKYLFNAKVGDKASFEKVMNTLVSKGMLTKNGDQYLLPQNFPGTSYLINSKDIIVASDSAMVGQYSAGSAKATFTSDVDGKVSGKPFGAYVDINKILQAFPLDSSSTADQVATMNKAKTTFKDLVGSTENFDGKLIKSSMQLRMVDGKKNSLASLAEFLAEAAKNIPHKESVDMDMNGQAPDSTTAPGVDSVK